MVLFSEFVLAATLLAGPVAGAPPVAHAAPLVTTVTVVDGRSVRLTDMGGAHGTAQRVVAEIGPAVAAVDDFWGTQWPRDIAVDITATDQQFSAATDGAFADVAAVAVATWVDPGQGLVQGQRIVFAPGAGQMSDAALRLVLRHELFHFAARGRTALDAPIWIVEGVADFVARPAAPVGARVAAALPADADLLGPEPARSRAYDAAWSFASFVADTYGSAALQQFYLRTAGADHVDAATATREVLGVELPDLLTQWARWQQATV